MKVKNFLEVEQHFEGYTTTTTNEMHLQKYEKITIIEKNTKKKKRGNKKQTSTINSNSDSAKSFFFLVFFAFGFFGNVLGEMFVISNSLMTIRSLFSGQNIPILNFIIFIEQNWRPIKI